MRPASLAFALLASLGLAHGADAFTPAGSDTVYEVGDDAFEGYYTPAQGEARGTVLIVHDWNGLDDYERQRADMLAEQAKRPPRGAHWLVLGVAILVAGFLLFVLLPKIAG